MASLFKLDKIDFRFIEIIHELYALEQYMDSIESQMPDLIKKEEDKVYQALRQKGYENDLTQLSTLDLDSSQIVL